jgi:hypothetical protein
VKPLIVPTVATQAPVHLKHSTFLNVCIPKFQKKGITIRSLRFRHQVGRNSYVLKRATLENRVKKSSQAFKYPINEFLSLGGQAHVFNYHEMDGSNTSTTLVSLFWIQLAYSDILYEIHLLHLMIP